MERSLVGAIQLWTLSAPRSPFRVWGNVAGTYLVNARTLLAYQDLPGIGLLCDGAQFRRARFVSTDLMREPRGILS